MILFPSPKFCVCVCRKETRQVVYQSNTLVGSSKAVSKMLGLEKHAVSVVFAHTLQFRALISFASEFCREVSKTHVPEAPKGSEGLQGAPRDRYPSGVVLLGGSQGFPCGGCGP